ncbi:MAG: NUDIX domain-containing protein [Oscillospiraceae bacterium]|jgi:8-oxo-dGTP pyrophosphatase MutT (NUDIX family)|nr:NUDIX domain-containing protein [Oscillospiraceae bacterium]
MLGRLFEIAVDEQVLEENPAYLYYGHINDESLNSEVSLYSQKIITIVNPKRFKKNFIAKVVATVSFEDETKPFLIMSPKRHIYYAPEIKNLLNKSIDKKITKLICTNEKSCGTVVFYKDFNDIKILLIKNIKNNHWSFPKGHIELGETEKETALREVFEETGLKVQILEGFREVISYWLFKKIKKTVVIFVSISKSSEVEIQKEEIKNFRWVNIDEAINFLKHKNDINIFSKAKEHFLRSYKFLKF